MDSHCRIPKAAPFYVTATALAYSRRSALPRPDMQADEDDLADETSTESAGTQFKGKHILYFSDQLFSHASRTLRELNTFSVTSRMFRASGGS
jgi:hypothetical protein